MKYGEASHIVSQMLQAEVAFNMEKGFLSTEDRRLFDSQIGNHITHLLPDASYGYNSKKWKKFKSSYSKAQHHFDLFDWRSYLRDDEDENADIRHVDTEKVQWGNRLLKHYLGTQLAWAVANRRPLTKGYGHEGYLVDGAGHTYAGQRARNLRAMARTITNKIFDEQKDFKEWTGHMNENGQYLPRTRNTNNEADKLRFAIDQLINRYGTNFAEELNKVEDPKFLTLGILKDFEESWNNGGDFDLVKRVAENKAVYDLTLDTLKTGNQHTYKYVKGRYITDKDSIEWKGSEPEISTMKQHKLYSKAQVKDKIYEQSKRRSNDRMDIGNGYDTMNQIYQQVTKNKKFDTNISWFMPFSLKGKNTDYDMNQLPVAEELAKDPNFIQAVLKERKYRHLTKQQLKDTLKKTNPAEYKTVKGVRKLFKMMEVLGNTDEGHANITISTPGATEADYIGERAGLPREETFNPFQIISERNIKHSNQQATNYVVKTLLKGTGRDPKFNPVENEKKYQDEARKSTLQLTRPVNINEVNSIRIYPQDLDVNSKAYQNEVMISNLSKERAHDGVNGMKHASGDIRSGTYAPTVEGDDAIAQQYRANEQNITQKAMYADPVQSPSYSTIGNHGTLSTGSTQFGNSQDYFEGKDERQQDRFEAANNEDDD